MLRRVVLSLHIVEDSALILALIVMLGMALLQIVLRNFFDAGFLWAESFLRILVLWVAILGAMVATRDGRHIAIDLVSKVLPVGWLRFTTTVTSLFSAAICFIAAWYCIDYIRYEYEDGTIAFGAVPVWICQSIMPLGFGVMGFRFLVWTLRKPD